MIRPIPTLIALFPLALAASCSPTGTPDSFLAVESARPRSAIASSDELSPRAVAGRFVAAAESGDGDELRELLTARASLTPPAAAGLLHPGPARAAWTVGEESIDGFTATVAIDFDDDHHHDHAEILLRRCSGEWRVCGVRTGEGDQVHEADFETATLDLPGH